MDSALNHLALTFDSPLVTFNRLDMAAGRATVISWPFRPEHVDAVELVNGQLGDHPLLSWVPRQILWPVVRLSDVASSQWLESSALYREVLRPLGASFSLFLFLSSPVSAQWIYFAVNRAGHDFNDRDLQLARRMQLVLVTALSHWSGSSTQTGPSVMLTPREHEVLGYLAAGLTAESIAHTMGTKRATVLKHLQNLYSKLAVHDRLSAVVRGREIGLLNEEDLARDLMQQIRIQMATAISVGVGD